MGIGLQVTVAAGEWTGKKGGFFVLALKMKEKNASFTPAFPSRSPQLSFLLLLLSKSHQTTSFDNKTKSNIQSLTKSKRLISCKKILYLHIASVHSGGLSIFNRSFDNKTNKQEGRDEKGGRRKLKERGAKKLSRKDISKTQQNNQNRS